MVISAFVCNVLISLICYRVMGFHVQISMPAVRMKVCRDVFLFNWMFCEHVCIYIYRLRGRVAEWLRAWDILTMFEATLCGRS